MHNLKLRRHIGLVVGGVGMWVAYVRRGAVPFAAMAALYLGGCAQITVVSDHAPPRTEWKFGVLAVDLADSNKNTIVQSSGVGIVSTPSGATLGYANARVVRLGDECRIVITARDLEAIKDRELQRILKTTHKACAA